MTYATLAAREGYQQDYLVILRPRVQLTSWTNTSGNIYWASHTRGYITTIEVDGTEKTEDTDNTPTSGKWYYEHSTQRLYYNTGGGSPASLFVTATYEIHLATRDIIWYRDPLDDTTDEVFYPGAILNYPIGLSNVSDSVFGFNPSFQSSISVDEIGSELGVHLSTSSFASATIEAYHAVGTPEVANIKKILRSNITAMNGDGARINIAVRDPFERLSATRLTKFQEFNFGAFQYVKCELFGKCTYNAGNNEGQLLFAKHYQSYDIYPGADPTASGYTNFVNGVDHFNLLNRMLKLDWISHASNSNTRKYVTDVTGLMVGDVVGFINETTYPDAKGGIAFASYRTVTAVNTASNYFDHTSLVLSWSADINIYRRDVDPVDNVVVKTDGTYRVISATIPVSYSSQITYNNFEVEFENSLSVAIDNDTQRIWVEHWPCSVIGLTTTTIADGETLYVKVYGDPSTLITNGGTEFGSANNTTGTLANPAVIIYQLLKGAGYSEDEINFTSFQTVEAANTKKVFLTNHDYLNVTGVGTYRAAINKICQSALVTLYIDFDGKIAIRDIAPYSGSADHALTDSEILKYSFDINYDEIYSHIKVFYDAKLFDLITTTTGTVDAVDNLRTTSSYASTTTQSAIGGGTQLTEAISETAKYLHKSNKVLEVNSVLTDATDAADLAEKLGYILSERKLTYTVSVPKTFVQADYDEHVDITRTKIPGYEFDKDTERTASGQIIAKKVTNSEIELVIDDQKGIQDNSGSW